MTDSIALTTEEIKHIEQRRKSQKQHNDIATAYRNLIKAANAFNAIVSSSGKASIYVNEEQVNLRSDTTRYTLYPAPDNTEEMGT